jgi:hypothetical protein
LKDRQQNAGHEIDQFVSSRGVDWHDDVLFYDRQVQEL